MPLSRSALLIIVFAAANGLVAQLCEGYAAHGLEEAAGSYAPTLYHTSAKYHMWHVLALLFAGLAFDRMTSRVARIVMVAAVAVMSAGMVSFAGGMYGVPFGASVYFAVAGAILLQISWGLLALAMLAQIMAGRPVPALPQMYAAWRG